MLFFELYKIMVNKVTFASSRRAIAPPPLDAPLLNTHTVVANRTARHAACLLQVFNDNKGFLMNNEDFKIYCSAYFRQRLWSTVVMEFATPRLVYTEKNVAARVVRITLNLSSSFTSVLLFACSFLSKNKNPTSDLPLIPFRGWWRGLPLLSTRTTPLWR